jgi:hypothetical protein
VSRTSDHGVVIDESPITAQTRPPPVNGHLGIRLRGQGFSGLVDRSYSGWVPVGW